VCLSFDAQCEGAGALQRQTQLKGARHQASGISLTVFDRDSALLWECMPRDTL
jgi:hypothetical protein